MCAKINWLQCLLRSLTQACISWSGMQAYAKVCCRRSFERGNEQTTICASAIWNLWLCQTVLVSFASIRAQYNAVILQPWGGNCHGISDALNQIWDDFLKCESFDPQEIVFAPRAISVWLLTWPYAVWLLRIAACSSLASKGYQAKVKSIFMN